MGRRPGRAGIAPLAQHHHAGGPKAVNSRHAVAEALGRGADLPGTNPTRALRTATIFRPHPWKVYDHVLRPVQVVALPPPAQARLPKRDISRPESGPKSDLFIGFGGPVCSSLFRQGFAHDLFRSAIGLPKRENRV